MRNFVEFGKDLYIEWAKAIPYNLKDLTMSHMHQAYELLLLPDPVPFSTIINDKTIVGTGPMAMIVAPYCMHFTYYVDKNITDKYFTAFYIGENYINTFPENIVPLKKLIGNAQALFLDISGYENTIKKIIEPIIETHQKRKKVNSHFYKSTDMMQKLMFGAIINVLCELNAEKTMRAVSSDENYIYKVVMYIVQNLDKNLSTPDIAANFFVSRDKLNRDFKQYTQMTIKDFVTQARMNLAKSKLTDTEHTISEISRMCGFENEIYFYSFFKKNMGMTPRQYAENMNKKRSVQ